MSLTENVDPPSERTIRCPAAHVGAISTSLLLPHFIRFVAERSVSSRPQKFSATSYFPLCVTISLLLLLFQLRLASVIDAAAAASAGLRQSDSA